MPRAFWGSVMLAPLVALGCQDDSGDPTPGPTVETIGPEGGEVASSDEILRIIIPPGAVTEPVEIEVTRSSDAPPSLGNAYRVSPEMDLMADATVIYNWFEVDVSGRDPNLITLARDIGAQWEQLNRLEIDFDVRTVTCADPRLSFHYGLIEAASIDSDTGTGTDTIGDTDTDGTDTIDPDTTDSATTDPPLTTTGPTTDTETTDTTTGPDETTSGTTTSGDPGDPLCGDGTPVATEVCYIEGLTYSSPMGASAVVAGDFDGDTNTDLAIAGEGDSTVSVRFGNGAGILLGETIYPVGDGPVAMTLADLDGGGDDIVLAVTGDAEVGVLLSNGDGTFVDYDGFGVGGTMPTYLATGDFDEDTNLDVAAANVGTGDVSIMLGDGAGALSNDTEIGVGGTPSGLGTGDFNGNDSLDLVTGVGSDLVINIGDGMGFGTAGTTDIGAPTAGLAVADFNDDMDLDAVVGDTTDNATIALGSGVGTFAVGVSAAVNDPQTVVAADISGDGDLDIVATNFADGTVTVLVGDGAGGFSESHTFNVGAGPSAIALGDFNNDSVPDIAVTNSGDDDTTLLLSNP